MNDRGEEKQNRGWKRKEAEDKVTDSLNAGKATMKTMDERE